MRTSGILLHVTSLPGSSGVGTLAEADRFIRFLRAAKQSYWQILPITPTDFVNSPYASPSAFAGNTLVIDAEELCRDGLISQDTLLDSKRARGNDYGYAIFHKEIILREAYANFLKNDPPRDYEDFCQNNAFWLKDYALFCALKKHFDGKSWLEWGDEDIRMRKAEAMERYASMLSDETDFVCFCQYVFHKQWRTFRQKLRAAQIKLIGDIPIYVAYDSADVWANPQLFDLTPDRRPNLVAGVPPDYFSEDGQLWGNPRLRQLLRHQIRRNYRSQGTLEKGYRLRISQTHSGQFPRAYHHCRGPWGHSRQRVGVERQVRTCGNENSAVRLRRKSAQSFFARQLQRALRCISRHARQRHNAGLVAKSATVATANRAGSYGLGQRRTYSAQIAYASCRKPCGNGNLQHAGYS